MDASMLTETAMMSRRPRTLDHKCDTSTSAASAAVREPALSVSVAVERSLDETERSLGERAGMSGTCHGTSGWSSYLDNAELYQSTPNAPSYKYRTQDNEQCKSRHRPQFSDIRQVALPVPVYLATFLVQRSGFWTTFSQNVTL